MITNAYNALLPSEHKMALASPPYQVRSAFKCELISANLWRTCIVVVGLAAIASLMVVAFTGLAESAFTQFYRFAALTL
jgi:hypothetical protein